MTVTDIERHVKKLSSVSIFLILLLNSFTELKILVKITGFTVLLQQLTVREGTAAYQAWVETPIPMYTKFYFFDMLNPRDLFHKHEKPILEERGPYTFRWGHSRG